MDFYERRLRRIIPILYLILILSIPFTLINFIAADSRNFFESLFAVVTFSSNFLFWLEEGEYFTRENSLKPLLHTWSLSIEMQFYIIFPLIIIIFRKKKLKIIIISSIKIFKLKNKICLITGSSKKKFDNLDRQIQRELLRKFIKIIITYNRQRRKHIIFFKKINENPFVDVRKKKKYLISL